MKETQNCFQIIHSFQSDLRPLRIQCEFSLLVGKLQLVWFSLLERKHKMDICTSLVWCMYIYTTCICCSHAADNCTMQIVLFNPFHTRFPMLAGMIFPIAMKNPPTTVMCFHLIPLGFALTIQVFESRIKFDFTKFKIRWIRWNFGGLNIHTHQSPNWMQFSVRETKLSHNFSHLGINGLPLPPPPPAQEADKAMSANAGVEGSTISMCVTTRPWFRGTHPLNLSFLQKPKVANGFESGS